MVRVCCHLCVCGSRKFSAMLAVRGEAGAGLSVPGHRVEALGYGLPEGPSQGCWCQEVSDRWFLSHLPPPELGISLKVFRREISAR